MRKRLIFTAFLVALPACSFFVSLDDLQDGGSAAGDASTNDAAVKDAADSAISADAPVDAGGDAPLGSTFLDDFNRADDPFIGNQWLLKTQGQLPLVGNVVRRISPDGGPNYEDNIVYRPASEDVADVEISVDILFTSNPSGYPQIWARMPSAIIAQPSLLTGYVFYITSADAATMSRNSGTDLTDFNNVNFSTSLSPGLVYRMQFRVTGTNPVHLTGTVTDVASGTVLGNGSYDDADPARLSSPGSVGFSASSSDVDVFTYDNFLRTSL